MRDYGRKFLVRSPVRSRAPREPGAAGADRGAAAADGGPVTAPGSHLGPNRGAR